MPCAVWICGVFEDLMLELGVNAFRMHLFSDLKSDEQRSPAADGLA